VRTLLTHQHRHPLSCRSVMPLPWRSSPGATTPASTTHSSSTSRVPVAAPPPSSASPPASLLGAPPPGPSGGGGRRGRRGRGGEGRGTPTQDPTPPLSLLFSEVRPGRPSPTRGQGVSPCSPTKVREGASSPAQAGSQGHECCLLRADLDSTSATQLIVAGGGGGIRLPWRSPSALWG
jgi:hypothetical protein